MIKAFIVAAFITAGYTPNPLTNKEAILPKNEYEYIEDRNNDKRIW